MNQLDKVNILMVDDQPAKLLSYEAILGELGDNLFKANSAREALEILLKNEIAVVLMDVSMPDLDGFQLAEMIRQHPRFQQTAIIFISAVHLTDIDRIKGYQRGAVDYISVPVIPELLRAKVSVFAELHRRARQLESLNNELRRLSARLLSTQDEERRRIARELHDGLGQELAGAKMMLDAIVQRAAIGVNVMQMATDASELVNRAIQQVRSMSHLLHPPLLDEIGLHSALQSYVDGLTKRSGIEAFIEVQPTDFPRLPSDLETAVFRIIQEALTNVFRHSNARNCWITLNCTPSRLSVNVRDDGVGVSPQIAEFRPGAIGIGLGGMRQRVKEFGGDLQIYNGAPGTVVEIAIPVSAPAAVATPATTHAAATL